MIKMAGFSIQVAWASGEPALVFRVAQRPETHQTLCASRVLKAFAAAHRKACGERLDAATLELCVAASAPPLVPTADVRYALISGATVFVRRKQAYTQAAALTDAVVGRSSRAPLPTTETQRPKLLHDGSAVGAVLCPVRDFTGCRATSSSSALRATLGESSWADAATWRAVLAERGNGRLRRALSTAQPSACYLGGSITEQQDGWRPRFHVWLERRLGVDVRAIDAFCGNAGSTLLAFTAKDWVLDAAPDVVFVEVAINDGDCLLEARSDATKKRDVARALEGTVRTLREALPECAVVFVEMFLRDDLCKQRRSGTKAWVDAEASERASAVYRSEVIEQHAAVARRYDCALVNLVPFFEACSTRALDALFRDDCHHTEQGAEHAAAALAKCVDELLLDDAPLTREPVPRPLDAKYWRSLGAKRFDADPHFLQISQPAKTNQPLLKRGTVDRCPVTGASSTWTWLYASHGETATCAFEGTALGLVTYVGPDSGKIRIVVDGGRVTRTVDLVDEWCYYWRSTIVLLVDDLERGYHTANISMLDEQPDRSRLKRPITDPNYLENPQLRTTPKLWLMWYFAIGA